MGRWRIGLDRRHDAGIEQQQAAAGHGTFISAESCRIERLAFRLGKIEQLLDLRSDLFLTAVEQRKTAIAMAEESQHRRHAIQKDLQHGGALGIERQQEAP
jgi:hypothetical protein